MAEKYKSQNGFVEVPIRRGFDEISKLFNVCQVTGATILGGYVRYMCSPRDNPVKAGDIDIYSPDESVFETIKQLLLATGLVVKNENPMAITFEQSPNFPLTTQLIKPINQGAIVAAGTMEEILSHFDFTVIRIGLLNATMALADADYLHDEEKGLLRLKTIHCPISSTLRCMKYAKKGYFLRPVECMKLFADWENRSIQYKQQITNGLLRIEAEERLTQEDINELERLMRID